VTQSRTSKVIETLFRIYDKEGLLVDFKLNNIQKRIDREIILPIENFRIHRGLGKQIPAEMQNSLRNSILKYRQGGVTTLVMAWYLVDCMDHYTVAVMLTHDSEHSEKLLYRARLMMKNLKGPKPQTSKLNEHEIAFAKTDSLFYIGTAGTKEFGRSATITNLHCSEIAFWKDPSNLMKSLYNAIPTATGVITQETTANGWGNWFQKSYYNYMDSKGGFNPKFYPWFIHEEYISRTPFVCNTVPEEERKHERMIWRLMRREFPFMTKQALKQKLQWRREKIDENEGDQSREAAVKAVNQEYPSTIYEAFIFSGGSLFSTVQKTTCDAWKYLGGQLYGHVEHPVVGFSYSLGADYSGGTGNDYSSIVVGCAQTKEQVAFFRSSVIDPIAFTEKIAEIGMRYNQALLVPESNAHGLAGLALLKRKYPVLSIYKSNVVQGFSNAQMNVNSHGYGWRTSATTKPYMVGIAQQFVLNGFRIYDTVLEDELRAFTEDPNTGKLESVGTHDDTAIAFMLMCIGILKLYRQEGIHPSEVDMGAKVIDQPAVKTSGKIIDASAWRDQHGAYQVPFNDMFSTKRRSGHAA
jgi:hypothetical protein